MSFRHRIRTIYGKELVDILRDRRTLIAMIVVPIVLYPLLMLGSVQAVSYQAASLDDETLVIGVVGEEEVNDRQARMLAFLIDQDQRVLEQERAREGPQSPENEDAPTGISQYKLVLVESAQRLAQVIRERAIHAGVIFEGDRLGFALNQTNRINILADLEDIRGQFAARKLNDLFDRKEERANRRRLRQQGLPTQFLNPLDVSIEDLSAPPSILGQILPLILILMTVTGAIYPAIDLTAGERERGTLESLMVSPIPVIDLIVGKFLVVTTVAIMGATLNLASVTATVYFGGFDKILASSEGSVPIGKMLLILVCLVPFAVFMSAVMIAVCSYARTFKEAQNYVTPVILAVLVPGGIAALPATRMEGVMLVMPVGNMVLLARDLLLGAAVSFGQVSIVLLSTTLYAGAAVAVAANIFGRESVVFADSASLKSTLSRRMIKPSLRPSVSMSLLFVAMLFPTWLFIQSALSPVPGGDEDARGLVYASAWLMPLLFVGLPLAVLLYWKVDVRGAWAMRKPAGRYLLAAVLIGVSAWVPAHELIVLQQSFVGTPQAVLESTELLGASLAALNPVVLILGIALIPAVCEELLFRGFLLSGLAGSARKWTAILVSAAVFGVFHFFLFKFAVTASLGIVLGYVCWQSRSIVVPMVVHVLHNALGAMSIVKPDWQRWMGVDPDAEWAHLPAHVLIPGVLVFVFALWIVSRPAVSMDDRATAAPAELRAG